MLARRTTEELAMNRFITAMFVAGALMLSACATAPTEQQADARAEHQHDSDVTAGSTDGGDQQAAAMAHMHGNMQKMREHMAKIHATKDPAERQRLMAEHRAAMRSQMHAMRGMMNEGSCPMMGSMSGGQGMGRGGMMGGNMGGKKGGMMGSAGQHQCAMMGHMQMMHGMMEQMMEHMSAEHGDKPDDAAIAPDQKQQEHVH